MFMGPSISGKFLKEVLGYRELQVLDYLCAELETSDATPTLGMISAALDIAQYDASKIIRVLERKGLVERVGKGRGRLIVLPHKRLAQGANNPGSGNVVDR
jgi:DNA-binding MarR family transcriptional regulator